MKGDGALFKSGGIGKHGSASHTSSGATAGWVMPYDSFLIDATGVVTKGPFHTWDASVPYLANNVALASDSQLYRAVISNTGNDPTTDDGTNWVLVGGNVTFVDSEVPTGTINGANLVFTLAFTPLSGSLKLYSDGVRMRGGGVDYTLVGTTITFGSTDQTPKTSLQADYRR